MEGFDAGCFPRKEVKMKKNFMGKKIITSALCLVMATACFAGCGDKTKANDGNAPITVIARETGSGTRDAFNELMGISTDGVDNTSPNAEISQSTAVVMATVAGNKNAIGYVSLGSLDDSVKAVQIDGIEAAVENIKNGSYAAARPFMIVTKDTNGKEDSERKMLKTDFEDFILSEQGQAIMADEGYITIDENAAEYEPQKNLKGKLVIAGSTSVAPVMQQIADAYKLMHENVTIEIQQTGSGAGITSTIEGACGIGMSSRELKAEELTEGLTETKIAMDGIAVIVNKENATDDLTSEQIRQIFTGEISDWSEARQ